MNDFSDELIALVDKHLKGDPNNLADLISDIVQFACGCTFEALGHEAGNVAIKRIVDSCYQYCKENPRPQK